MEISRAALEAIVGQAERSPEREICGLLLGVPDRIQSAQQTENVATDPRTGFEVDPQGLFAAIRDARAGGKALLGHYHSHPRGNPTPSERDRASAMSLGELWVIVADGEARGWRVASRGRFEAVELVLATASAKRQ